MSTLRTLTSRMLIGNLDIPLIMVMSPNIQSFQKSSKKLNSQQKTNSGWVDFFWGNDRDVITCRGMTAGMMGNENQYSDFEAIGATVTSSLSSTINSLNPYNDKKNTRTGTYSAHGPKQWAEIERSLLRLEQIYKLDKERIGSLVEMLDVDQTSAKNIATKVTNLFRKEKKEVTENQKRAELIDKIRNGTAKRAQSFIIYNYTIYWGYFMSFDYSKDTENLRNWEYNFTFKVTDSSTDWLSRSLLENFPEARALGLFGQLKDVTTYAVSLTMNTDKLVKSLFI